ncbi:sulfite exporter TauE/SafE family protein [Curvivirga sp.]|uniref:sulfite exporter TauE/SafE family protein n=1 Tax=Curvivirga sp. TaxID=2856848 RepID=UPI003B5A734C
MSDLYYLYLIIAVFASCVSALFGMGAALILLAVGAYLFNPAESIALATIIFASNTIARSITMWRDIPWKLGIYMALLSMPFAFLGAELMPYLPTDILRKALGILILSHILITWSHFQIKIGKSYPAYGALSAVYGFLSGLLGSGNPVKAIFFHHMGFSKQAFVGLMAISSVPANIVKLISYQQSGLMEFIPFQVPIALIAISLVVAFFGKYALKRIPDKSFQYGLQLVLAISALGLIFVDPMTVIN